METVTTVPASSSVQHTHPALNWGAVFSGWLVATATAALLYVAGLALGFSAFDPHNSALTAKGIPIGAALWMILTWGGSLFIGGLFASWFDGRNDAEMGAVRGITVWGLAVSATGLLIVTGLAHFGFINIDAYASTGTPTGVDAETVAHYTAATMWVAFLSGLFALVTSAFGGWLGARHVHHVYHLRVYEAPRRI